MFRRDQKNFIKYRFTGENALLENFYLMISIFREYNIIPLFVFDGKPPKEKNELLKKRRDDKKIAQNKYNELKDKLDAGNETNIKEIKEIKENMEILKKDFIKVHHTDIENVKELIKALGVSYIEAPGEADKLCAKLVCKNNVYACLSEDMDLFVYGTTRVLRYLSLLNKTVIMYDTKSILSQLNLTLDFNANQNFVLTATGNVTLANPSTEAVGQSGIIVLIQDGTGSRTLSTGTDYETPTDNSLFKTLKYFKKYKKSDKFDFYEWLDENTNYVDNIYNLYGVISLFNLGNMPEYKDFEKIRIMNSPINESILKNIMEKEDFIFVN